MKTIVVIDIPNLYHCFKKKYNAKVSFPKLMDLINKSVKGPYETVAVATYLDAKATPFFDVLAANNIKADLCKTSKSHPYNVAAHIITHVVPLLTLNTKFVFVGSATDLRPFIDLLGHDHEILLIGCGLPATMKQRYLSIELSEAYCEKTEKSIKPS